MPSKRKAQSEGLPPTLRNLPLAPPGGMRDLLPPASELRADLRRELMQSFGRSGYARVTTPPFEYEDVIARGLETVDREDLVRFVEPDTGEVVVLRPDITPQIARIVATRLSDQPGPWKLCYEGTVIRRRRGRARKQQQIFQAGIECIGVEGPEADAEVIHIAAQSCRAVGLSDFKIELAQCRLGSIELEAVPEAFREIVIEALSKKDVAELEQELQRAKVPSQARQRIEALAHLYGGLDMIDQARKELKGKQVNKALDRLEAVVTRLCELGLEDHLCVDLGELRGQHYYTGVSMTLLAAGPGEAIGSGGRYDRLLEAYGFAQPATGFAFDVDNLEWALRAKEDV